MPTKPLSASKLRNIIALHVASRLSYRDLSRVFNVSSGTVGKCIAAFERSWLSLAKARRLTDRALREPSKEACTFRCRPLRQLSPSPPTGKPIQQSFKLEVLRQPLINHAVAPSTIDVPFPAPEHAWIAEWGGSYERSRTNWRE
jgi:hypothetical protein